MTETLDLVAAADQHEAAGELFEAIDALSEANRRQRDQALEERLRDLRQRAVALVVDGPRRTEWPPAYDDAFPDVDGIPEIAASELDDDKLGGGILHHGALTVRGLFDDTQAATIVDHIERAFAEYDALPDKTATPEGGRWFRPYESATQPGLPQMRSWVADHRGLWLADSPPALFDVLDVFRATGVLGAVTGYLGERPALSLQKTTLRCTPATNRLASWHQDGAFLQGSVRTVNVWVALTDCGGRGSDAPALDIFPRRFDEVLEPTGPPVPHRVPPETAAKLALETPVQRPRFAAGDALLFDELFVHRTAVSPRMTRDRYALEAWLFAPSSFPGDYIPFIC